MNALSRPWPIALTIAGFDPSSGAGITADLKTFSAHHVYGVACISALTVQSTLGVRSVHPLSGSLIRETLHCLAEDVELSGIKIGMLGSAQAAREVTSFLKSLESRLPRHRIVLDPVLRSSSGAPLLEPEGVQVIRESLLAQVGWITPNLEELALVLGEDPRATGSLTRETVPAAATRLQRLAAILGNPDLNVVTTGGHLSQPDDFLVESSGTQRWFPGKTVVTNQTHGTGCAFSSALLAALISGLPSSQAVSAAKSYVTGALQSAYPVGKGKGPMNHFFKVQANEQ